MSSAAFYISGHGFGHASRQIEIINALGTCVPSLSILVRTSAPRWLFERTLRVPVTWLPGECDTGVAQFDSLNLDPRATILQAAEFHRTFDERTRREAELLREHDAAVVIADAPPLACAAASRAGVPCVVVANFTWDWIYEGYPEHLEEAPGLLPEIRDAYAQATAGWRLPMHGGFASIATVADVPFVARHATHARADVRARLGLQPDRPLVLTSFGGYGVKNVDLARLDCLDVYTVIVTEHGGPRHEPAPGVLAIPEGAIYESGLRYEDLVAAVDVVATKPGYGIISECLANGAAMLYTSRGVFREYDVLVAEMPRFLRSRFIDHDALLAGRWRAPLDALLSAPPPPDRPATHGARVIAERVRSQFSI